MIEYKVSDSPMVLDQDELNQYGADGWELCQLITRPMTSTGNRMYFHYIFERKAKK
jgi:hypothetical protein